MSDDSYGKAVPKQRKIKFSISKYRQMIFSSETPHSVKCNMNISGLEEATFRLRNSTDEFQLPSKQAYNAVLPIEGKKWMI
jgi:hypothetical protein